MPPKPGEIYWALDGRNKRRLVAILSREELNRGNYVVAIPLTSQRIEDRAGLPNCVPFEAGQFGLTKACIAQAEAITHMRKNDLVLDEGPLGMLDAEAERDLIGAAGYVISADCEPE